MVHEEHVSSMVLQKIRAHALRQTVVRHRIKSRQQFRAMEATVRQAAAATEADHTSPPLSRPTSAPSRVTNRPSDARSRYSQTASLAQGK